jgi:hypothetical protein
MQILRVLPAAAALANPMSLPQAAAATPRPFIGLSFGF